MSTIAKNSSSSRSTRLCVYVVLKLRVKLRESLEQDIVVIMAENKLSAAETFKKLD